MQAATTQLSSVAPLKRVSVILTEPVSLFEFAVAVEVFGTDRRDAGIEPFDLRICAPDIGRGLISKTVTPFTIMPTHDLDGVRGSNLVIISATPPRGEHGYPPEIVDCIRRAHADGAILLGLSSGTFLLGAAGLLDGRRCTTHWLYAEELQADFPESEVDPDALFVDEGEIVTSAGTAAGVDAALHLLRRELGTEVADQIARRMVVPPHREGGQQQFVTTPPPIEASAPLGSLLVWVSEHLRAQHTVGSLARRVNMSERTFARRFHAATGTSPYKWINQQRVLQARRLLEETDITVEGVADRVGFNSAVVLRDHFRRYVGLAPADYRRRFGPSEQQ